MSLEERLEVAALIAHLNRAEDCVFQAGLDQRMSDMDAGQKTTETELNRLHAELLAQGR